MNRPLSKRGWIIILILLISLVLGIDALFKPRPVPGQQPLTDIQNIKTLRTQFNQDAGKTRLIILVSPT